METMTHIQVDKILPCVEANRVQHNERWGHVQKKGLSGLRLFSLDLLSMTLSLCEKPQQKLSLLIGVKGRGHNDVAASTQHELVEDASLVDEDAGGCLGVGSVATILPVLLNLTQKKCSDSCIPLPN